MGNWQRDQISAMAASTHLVGTRLTRNPTRTAPSEKKAKKLVPIRPNWAWVRPTSRMIGTADKPSTALSAKLSSMNAKSIRTIVHAREAAVLCTMI
jgi:hypothetical protein